MTKEQDYIPCGNEWKKEVSKMRKAEIIDMLATVIHERDQLCKVFPVKEPTALDLIAQEREKQKITKIEITVSGPGGVRLCSSASNAEFMTVTEAFDTFLKDLTFLKGEDLEKFKNITLK